MYILRAQGVNLSVQAPTATRCPLCGRTIDPAVLQLHLAVEERVARILTTEYPNWRREMGACPECVQDAVQQALRDRSHSSLQDELLLPYPIYSRDAARILPTPTRMNANPQFRGRGVTIAFLDSGFYPHPDLTRPHNRIVRYVDATGDKPNEKDHFKKPEVTSWHGTMTSCVAAGSGFMSDGLYRGIASEARVVLVKTGNRRGRRIHDKDIYRALAWVITNQNRYNIRIVNLSLGGDRPAQIGHLGELDFLVEEAVARGLVVVAASGNGGVQRIIPPASAPSAITVGGVDDQNSLDRRAHRMYWSNYGFGVNTLVKPEVTAPAIWLAAPMLPKTWVQNEALFLWHLERASDAELREILKTDYAQARFKKETLRQPIPEIRRAIRRRMIEQKFIHPYYQHVDGTSFAAPIVSSVVAQLLEANPSLTPAQVKEILIGTAQPLDDVPFEKQGYGVVNPPRAVAAALRAPGGALEGLPHSPQILPHGITFTYYDEDARSVALLGSFNDWQARGYEMRARAPGVWQIYIERLAPGTYTYKFLIDHSRWTHDPENPARIEDGYGGFSSLLTVNPDGMVR